MGAVSDAGRDHSRGRVVDTTDDGVKIYEVLGSGGGIVGYTFDERRLKELRAAGAAIHSEPEVNGAITVQVGVTSVAACATAIAGFVAMTVFPAVRVAKLAWRLGKLVLKYGPKLVARIFKGARGIAGRTVENDIIDLGKALTGVTALASCGL